MTCARTGGEHAAAFLGVEDDGAFAHRCGNCGLIGKSAVRDGEIAWEGEGERAASDPVPALAASSIAKGE